MRKIKFRGLTPKGWIYGSYIPGDSESGKPECIYDLEADMFFPITEGTGCQYTGLKDKNGVEIYEGDVIRLYFDTEKVEDWMWLQLTVEQQKVGYLDREVAIPDIYRNALPDEIEVIGNIYENPELLEPK